MGLLNKLSNTLLAATALSAGATTLASETCVWEGSKKLTLNYENMEIITRGGQPMFLDVLAKATDECGVIEENLDYLLQIDVNFTYYKPTVLSYELSNGSQPEIQSFSGTGRAQTASFGFNRGTSDLLGLTIEGDLDLSSVTLIGAERLKKEKKS